MQFIISAKAGLVNAVEGTANVRIQEQVPAGSPIQTGSAGRVEILLNPGSFLRLAENSLAVLDSVELTNIRVHVISGSAIIEAGSVEKDSPIRVTNGQLKVSIVAPGIYRFSENTASVLDGELRTEDTALSIDKGRQIKARGDQDDQYEESKIPSPEQVTSLDEWSQQRSKQIASANARSSDTDSASNSLVPSDPRLFLYPGAISPYSFPSRVVPSPTPFSFFQWYNGGYGFYQPLMPGPPVFIYPPYRIGHYRPLPYPVPSVSRPPMITPSAPPPHPTPHPAPHPLPSRPGIPRGRR
jgi:FecR protein